MGFNNISAKSKIKKVGKLPVDLDESSGIIYHKTTGNFISLNDSGNESELFTIDIEGNLINTQLFPQLKNNDWEDLCSDTDGNIYIGDFGNNSQQRKNLAIYKISGSKIDTISFRYADQITFPPKVKNFDCEAFFWHEGELYLFSKNWEKDKKVCKIYKLPANAGDYTLSPLTDIVLETQVTAADINSSGTEFVLLTYGKALFFAIENGIIDFSKPKYCRKTRRMQTEAICYKTDKELYFTNEQGGFYSLTIE